MAALWEAMEDWVGGETIGREAGDPALAAAAAAAAAAVAAFLAAKI